MNTNSYANLITDEFNRQKMNKDKKLVLCRLQQLNRPIRYRILEKDRSELKRNSLVEEAYSDGTLINLQLEWNLLNIKQII